MSKIVEFVEKYYKMIVSGSLISIVVLFFISVLYLKSICDATTSTAFSASESESALQNLDKYGIQILPN